MPLKQFSSYTLEKTTCSKARGANVRVWTLGCTDELRINIYISKDCDSAILVKKNTEKVTKQTREVISQYFMSFSLFVDFPFDLLSMYYSFVCTLVFHCYTRISCTDFF